jgi:chromosome segregation ATPase
MSDPTTDRLSQIQAELAQLLEERLSQLQSALRSTEHTARRVLSAEMDLARIAADREHHERELAALEAELGQARSRAADARRSHLDLVAARDQQRAELDRLERDVRAVDADAAQVRQRVAALQSEGEALREENNSLKVKLKTLEENVGRMKSLRQELMSSISALTAEARATSSGE